jgi:hypothetical protein
MAVTVGLLGELGYVGIDAVLVPTPPGVSAAAYASRSRYRASLRTASAVSGTSCSSESICSSTTWGHRGS